MELLPILFVLGGVTVLGLITALVVAVRKADRRIADHVRNILQRGSTTQQALNQLAAEGVDPKQAINVVKRLVRTMQKEAWINQTLEMLNAGTPEEQIREALAAKGLKSETAEALVQELGHPPWIQRHPIASAAIGIPIMIAGCAVLVASLIVRDGNLTGKWVTFPYAGLVTKLVGVFIFVIGLVLTVLPFKKPGFLTLDDGE
jgi:hypothetical protein